MKIQVAFDENRGLFFLFNAKFIKVLASKPRTTPDKSIHSLIFCYLPDFLYIYLGFKRNY